MENRRNFIRNAGMAIVASALPAVSKAFSAPSLKRTPGMTDSEYWGMVRNSFPLDHKRTYMNNGTMGPSPDSVIRAQKLQMDFTNIQARYGGGESEAVNAIARFINADKEEIALTHNVTEGLNIVCWGLDLKKGDEVIITDQEHAGHGLPWLNRARVDGIVPRVISPASTAVETLNRIKSAVTKNTRVIAVPHILCTTGQILPGKAIAQFAREKGIFCLLDGAHAPGMIRVDVHDIGCDFYASCCHKWMLGPKGTGFVYVRKDRISELNATHVGAHATGDWELSKDKVMLDGLAGTAHRYYYGTQSAILYKGIEAAVEYQESIGIDRIEKRVRSLAQRFVDKLKDRPDRVEILTPDEQDSRAAVISFRFLKEDNKAFYEYAASQNFTLRYVPESNLHCLRISHHIYNNEDDVDRLVGLINDWDGSH